MKTSMKAKLLKGIALLSFWLHCSVGYAGEIILKSELWEFICKIEVAVGPESPDVIENVHEFPGVQAGGEYVNGIVFTGEGRLCYRRSSVVDDCYSELNHWVCYTNYGDESEVVYIY